MGKYRGVKKQTSAIFHWEHKTAEMRHPRGKKTKRTQTLLPICYNFKGILVRTAFLF